VRVGRRGVGHPALAIDLSSIGRSQRHAMLPKKRDVAHIRLRMTSICPTA
jgi:hypothetical protein